MAMIAPLRTLPLSLRSRSRWCCGRHGRRLASPVSNRPAMLPENRPLEKLALTTSTGSWSPSRGVDIARFLERQRHGKIARVRARHPPNRPAVRRRVHIPSSPTRPSPRGVSSAPRPTSPRIPESARRGCRLRSQGSRQNLFAAAAMTIPSPGSIRIFAAAPHSPAVTDPLAEIVVVNHPADAVAGTGRQIDIRQVDGGHRGGRHLHGGPGRCGEDGLLVRADLAKVEHAEPNQVVHAGVDGRGAAWSVV